MAMGLVIVIEMWRCWCWTGVDKVKSHDTRLWAPEVEYEVLLLQFAGGVTGTLEEAQDGLVTQGVRGGVKMVGNRKLVVFVAYRAQMLYETASGSMFSLTKVEEATTAVDTVDQVDGCTVVPLSDMK
eukprot:g43864.t1